MRSIKASGSLLDMRLANMRSIHLRGWNTVMVINSREVCSLPQQQYYCWRSHRSFRSRLIAEAVALEVHIVATFGSLAIYPSPYLQTRMRRHELTHAGRIRLHRCVFQDFYLPVFPSIISEECGRLMAWTLAFELHLFAPYPPIHRTR